MSDRRIAELEAENARLREELDKVNDLSVNLWAVEVERLHEALRRARESVSEHYLPSAGERVTTDLGFTGTVCYGRPPSSARNLGLIVPVNLDGDETETLWFAPRSLRPVQ